VTAALTQDLTLEEAQVLAQALDLLASDSSNSFTPPSPTGDTEAALKLFEKTIAGRHTLWIPPAKTCRA
jgi:hypothetical protein